MRRRGTEVLADQASLLSLTLEGPLEGPLAGPSVLHARSPTSPPSPPARVAAEADADADADASARLRQMFDCHHNLLWRTLRRYGLDPEAAADVAQQAFVVAIERIDDIWEGRERAFLVGTALRLARKHRSTAARMPLEAGIEQRAQRASGAESQAITLELLDRVLGQLDVGLVEVFVLFDVEGFSTKEIASALSLPEGTVASRLRRAREEFRQATHRLTLVLEREEGGR